MKYLNIILVIFLLIGCKNSKKDNKTLAVLDKTSTKEFIIIDQDFEKALQVASAENKLIFIDFYTTWCAPCKKLDKLVFKNDSIQQILKKDFVLLKYNAENDRNQYYYRSDHYNFAKQNIPVIFYFNGEHPDYHKATDTPDKINYPLLAKRTKLIFATAWQLANRTTYLTHNQDI